MLDRRGISVGIGASFFVFLDDELGSWGFDEELLSGLIDGAALIQDQINKFLSLLNEKIDTWSEILAYLMWVGMFYNAVGIFWIIESNKKVPYF